MTDLLFTQNVGIRYHRWSHRHTVPTGCYSDLYHLSGLFHVRGVTTQKSGLSWLWNLKPLEDLNPELQALMFSIKGLLATRSVQLSALTAGDIITATVAVKYMCPTWLRRSSRGGTPCRRQCEWWERLGGWGWHQAPPDFNIYCRTKGDTNFKVPLIFYTAKEAVNCHSN